MVDKIELSPHEQRAHEGFVYIGLLGANLFNQTVGFAPGLHHVEHVADVDTYAASQLLVEENV